MTKRAVDIALALPLVLLTAPLVALLALAVRLESRGDPIYRQTRVGKDGELFEIYKLRTMVHGAEFTGAGLAIAAGDARITRLGALLRRYSLDELPNLWNVLRGEMSIVGPRPTVKGQVDQYTARQRGRLAVKPGITGWAQINGRASLPWPERIELDLWYVEHRSLALDLRILSRTLGQVLRGHGIYKGADRRMAASPADVAVLLTGVGKRYALVSVFAQHAVTIAADPNPLAPAQYAAHHRRSVPPFTTPATSRRCARCAPSSGWARWCRSPTWTWRSSGTRRTTPPTRYPRSSPTARSRARRLTSTRPIGCCKRLGLPSPPTVLPGEPVDSYPVMIKPRWGSGARSIHLAQDEREAAFLAEYIREPAMMQRAMQGPEFSMDCLSDLDGRCLNVIPRTMIESRGGESIKGTVIADEELMDLGRRVVEALGCRGPCTVQAFRDPEIGLGITDVNTRFGGACPAHLYAALPGRTYPELIVRMARGERIEPHIGEFRDGVTFTRYYWQLELDGELRPTGRDLISPPGPPVPRAGGAVS